MDLASLKNLDVKDILGKIKGGGLADILKNKKFLIKFGILGGSILILLIIYSFSVKPKIVKPKKQPSFIGGVYAVLIADVTLSFDNVLGVAAASRDHTYLLIFGLLLSVFLIATAATFFAEYIKKHSWVGLLGLVIILFVALQLIFGGIEARFPGSIPEPFKSWI